MRVVVITRLCCPVWMQSFHGFPAEIGRNWLDRTRVPAFNQKEWLSLQRDLWEAILIFEDSSIPALRCQCPAIHCGAVLASYIACSMEAKLPHLR